MKLILVIAALIMLAPLKLQADFICGAEVSYKLERGNGAKGSEKTAEETFFGKVHKKGATEEAAKKLVSEAIVAEKGKARGLCREHHENLAGCIAAKHTSLAGKISGLTFSARKSLEEAISKDCAAQQGHCIEAGAPEITCEEEAKPATAEGDAAKAEGGKGEKEKGGKKK